MNVKPIKTETDYQQALKKIETLLEVEANTPEWEQLDILTTLVEAYETQHYPIDSPSQIEAIFYYLESRNQGFSTFIDGLKTKGVSEKIIQDVLNDLNILPS